MCDSAVAQKHDLAEEMKRIDEQLAEKKTLVEQYERQAQEAGSETNADSADPAETMGEGGEGTEGSTAEADATVAAEATRQEL